MCYRLQINIPKKGFHSYHDNYICVSKTKYTQHAKSCHSSCHAQFDQRIQTAILSVIFEHPSSPSKRDVSVFSKSVPSRDSKISSFVSKTSLNFKSQLVLVIISSINP